MGSGSLQGLGAEMPSWPLPVWGSCQLLWLMVPSLQSSASPGERLSLMVPKSNELCRLI